MRKSIEKYAHCDIIFLVGFFFRGTILTDMGTVRLAVREVAESKGITTPFALSGLTGLNYAICHRLWQGKQQRIDMSTLAKLCDFLKVKPGQLFEYILD